MGTGGRGRLRRRRIRAALGRVRLIQGAIPALRRRSGSLQRRGDLEPADTGRYVLDAGGVIAYAEVSPDHGHLPDPAVFLPVLDRLRALRAA